MQHSPFLRRWTGGTAAVNGMEEQDRVDASTNFCSRPVAVTGWRHLRPRPVDCPILFSLLNLWLSMVGENSTIARLTLLYLAELLCDCVMLMYILWTNVCCCLMAENEI